MQDVAPMRVFRLDKSLLWYATGWKPNEVRTNARTQSTQLAEQLRPTLLNWRMVQGRHKIRHNPENAKSGKARVSPAIH